MSAKNKQTNYGGALNVIYRLTTIDDHRTTRSTSTKRQRWVKSIIRYHLVLTWTGTTTMQTQTVADTAWNWLMYLITLIRWPDLCPYLCRLTPLFERINPINIALEHYITHVEPNWKYKHLLYEFKTSRFIVQTTSNEITRYWIL